MSEWERVGPVVYCQIHTDRMVDDGKYNDELLAQVDEMWIGPDGVVASVGGAAVLHAHHRLHLNKVRSVRPKEFRPNRLLSFGFTSHYAAMAKRFGEAPLGCAGEDVIVETEVRITQADVEHGLQLRRGDDVINFEGVAVARPCVPFTKWLLKNQDAADDVVAEYRSFLGEGMRGFVVGLDNQTELRSITVGDELWRKIG